MTLRPEFARSFWPASGLRPVALGVVALSLAACGGGGADADAEVTKSTGVFLDSPVAGLDYYIGGVRAGVTNASGQFQYTPGDSVTFRIGNVTLGTVSGANLATVTPADLSADAGVISNILVLLQSLDADHNPANGIEITPASATALRTALNLSASGSTLASVQSDLPGLSLVDETAALNHFATSASDAAVNAGVTATLNAAVGYWQYDCDGAGMTQVYEVEKVAGSTRQLHFKRALVRTYANANCTGTYTESTKGGSSAQDYAVVLGALLAADGSVNAFVSAPGQSGAGVLSYRSTLSADKNTWVSVWGNPSQMQVAKRVSTYAFAGDVPVVGQAASVFDQHLGSSYDLSFLSTYSEIDMLQVDRATGAWRHELYEPTVAGKWHRFLETDEAVLGSNGWEIAPRLSGSYVTLNSNSIRLSSPYFNGGTLTMTASGARDLAGLTLRSEMPGADNISPYAVFPAGAKSYTVTEQSTAVSYFLGWNAGSLYATNLTDLVNRYRTGGTLERLPFEGTGSDTYVMSFANPAFNLNGGVVNFWHASNLEVLFGTGHYKVINVAGQQLLVVDVVPAAVLDSSPFYREEYDGGSRPIYALANVNGVTGAYRGWSWGYGETYVEHNRIALDAMLNAMGATCPLPDFNQTSTCADGSSGIASAGLARAQSLGAPMRARNRAR